MCDHRPMRPLYFAAFALLLNACESDPHVDRADSSLDAPETREASVDDASVLPDGGMDAAVDAGD